MSATAYGFGDARVAAFPGAEGFGATALGGRGGRVIKVTNLNASGPGSLQAACAEQGPRIVVFDIAGVIRGDVDIKHPFITIAGQSAPAPGITIEGRLRSRPDPWRRLHDIVVRFLRIRPPPAIGHEGDAIQFPDTERVMLDHLSLAWANDEIVDVIHASEVTLQWSTLEESDVAGHGKGVPHNLALLSAYPGSGNVSIHHNLFAHHAGRAPSLSPYEPGKPGDFRNNVAYDFRVGLTHDGHVPKEAVNLVANYYKRGPASRRITPFAFHASGRYHVAGNVVDGVGSLDDVLGGRVRAPAWLRIDRRGERLAAPAPVAPVATQDAEDAYRAVLRQAGSFPRDRVTVRTVEEVLAGTGGWGRGGPARPTDDWYLAGLARDIARTDTDNDGMPDDWESAHGLDPAVGTDHGRVLPGGYTAIESYLNERAALLIDAHLRDRAEAAVVLGASYARGWPVHELRGRRVVNRGVAGERTADMLRRFDKDVLEAAPRSVILWGFINDIHAAGGEPIEQVLASTRQNIAAMVHRARANGIVPVLATEVTIREPDGLLNTLAGWLGRLRSKKSYQEVVNERVLATNEWIRQLARDEGIVVLDFQPVLAGADARRKKAYATPDGTHISPAGYDALSAHAEETLARAWKP